MSSVTPRRLATRLSVEAPSTPPPRPSRLAEQAGQFLLQALSPRLPKIESPPPPEALGPAAPFKIPRRGAQGKLAATWYTAVGKPRGTVLLVHPWHGRGQAYFHRHRRVPSLRDAGYHVMTFDLGGIGASGPRRSTFADRDVVDALEAARAKAPGLPLHLWGVCLGGYWSHLAALETPSVGGMLFEDVTPHPLVWSRRQAPWGRPAYSFFERVLATTYRYLDLFHQSPRLSQRPTAWVSGAWNTTVLPEETRELARRAGGRSLIVDDAGHLECIRRGGPQVVELALETFERAS